MFSGAKGVGITKQTMERTPGLQVLRVESPQGQEVQEYQQQDNLQHLHQVRELLFECAKVAIVKDSSANKRGVMTSSYEVAASMLLSKEEFMPIKAEIVEDVASLFWERARSTGP
eukprot:gene40033-49501_t